MGLRCSESRTAAGWKPNTVVSTCTASASQDGMSTQTTPSCRFSSSSRSPAANRSTPVSDTSRTSTAHHPPSRSPPTGDHRRAGSAPAATRSAAAHHGKRLLGDLQLLVGGHREDGHLRIVRGEKAWLARGGLVARRVDADAEPLEPAERLRAHAGRVLADAGGEDDRVEPAERCVVGADVLPDAIAVHIERELGGVVSGFGPPHHVTDVVVAADPLEAGLLGEQDLDLLVREARDAMQVEDGGRIDVAG